MTEEPTGFSSRIDEVSRIKLLLAVARVKGSLLSTKEIEELTSLLPNGFDLGSIWNQIPSLGSRYELQAGLLIEKQPSYRQALSKTLNDSSQRRARAERYVDYARQFALLSGKRWIRVFSVAGSTSYKAPSAYDDIDIFSVTENGALWIFLTKALLLARVLKLIRPRSPRFCFSCMLDEEYARRLFASPKDALFARDALTAQVLEGSSFYDGLLLGGRWLSDYFPKLHKLRTARHVETEKVVTVTCPTATRKVLNHFLFLTVGNYVRLRSNLLNRKFRKIGRHDSFFRIISGRDHCIFESQSYQELRRIYGEFKPHSAAHQPPKNRRVPSTE
jgi:hypothetical protein